MRLLRRHNVALVIADRLEIRALQTHDLTTDWTFVHFHVGTRGRRGSYSETELIGVGCAHPLVARDGELHFNNDWEGFAPQNARRLRRLLQSETDD